VFHANFFLKTAFELWFKQILYEIDSVREIFDTPHLEENKLLTVISRLNRVVEILKVMKYKSFFQFLPANFHVVHINQSYFIRKIICQIFGVLSSILPPNVYAVLFRSL